MNLKKFIPTYHNLGNEVYEYRFTVFTPVFNCENTIKRVHQSLIDQSYMDFEWLVINDGSTDKSHEIIKDLIKTSPLCINYINNEQNQHKMGCFIQAISLAKGELLITFDGDDECVPNALEVFNEEFLSIPEHLKESVVAVTGLCQDQFGNQIGDKFPTSPFFSNSFKSYAIDSVRGEKWGFTKTSILKGIQVDEQIFSKGLIPESLIWYLIAYEGYRTKYINKVLRIYHVDMENSLSSTSIQGRAYGSAIHSIAVINWFFPSSYLKTPKFFLRNIYVLLRASKYLPYKLRDYLEGIESKGIKLLFWLLWPLRKFTR